jgi:hypothetical protein
MRIIFTGVDILKLFMTRLSMRMTWFLCYLWTGHSCTKTSNQTAEFLSGLFVALPQTVDTRRNMYFLVLSYPVHITPNILTHLCFLASIIFLLS